jgi:Insertion element 4 transposase N-terminal/Transposase DDE domain
MRMLGEALVAGGTGPRSESFEVFARTLDLRWVRQALEATGTVSVRRRKLPAEFVVWIVIGMALLHDRSIAEVVRHLNLVLPDSHVPDGRGHVTGGAVAQARTRLGPQPLAALFALTAAHWGTASAAALRWRGLAVYGVDGTTLRVPDTPANARAYGRPGTAQGPAAYPLMRVVALMVLRSHLLAGLVPGACTQSELSVAASLWPTLPDHSVTIVDKGFVAYAVWHQIHSHGTQRHWLTRAKAHLRWSVLRTLAPGDDLIEIAVHRNLRRAHPELPPTLTARAIRYQRRGFRPQLLLTSLLDAVAYPAAEIVTLYHERWELEIGFDEVKTHTLERLETLRSKAPARLAQELWGLAIGYNLVRLEMARVAEQAHLPPTAISYRHALMLVRNFWVTAWLASPGVLPRRLDQLHAEMALLILPKRRPRICPRVVKLQTSSYPRALSSRRLHPSE